MRGPGVDVWGQVGGVEGLRGQGEADGRGKECGGTWDLAEKREGK